MGASLKDGDVYRGAQVLGLGEVGTRAQRARYRCVCLVCRYRFTKLRTSLLLSTPEPACPRCLAPRFAEFGRRGRAALDAEFASGRRPFRTTEKQRKKAKRWRDLEAGKVGS
jgi:hypothetical protein